jgi:hypothetical protein
MPRLLPLPSSHQRSCKARTGGLNFSTYLRLLEKSVYDLSDLPETQSFISPKLAEETKFPVPGRACGHSVAHAGGRCPVLLHGPQAFPELCSPLLSCPFVLCVAAGRDVRADAAQPGKGKTKLLSGERSPAGEATPARPPGLLPRDPDLGPRDPGPTPRPRPRNPGPASRSVARPPRPQTRDLSPGPAAPAPRPWPGARPRSPGSETQDRPPGARPARYLGVHAGGRHAS